MNLFEDFKDLLAAFEASKVKFVLLGGYAVSFHGRPRSTSGIEFAPVYERAIKTLIDGVAIRVISLADRITNKLASGRPQDLEDVRSLRQLES